MKLPYRQFVFTVPKLLKPYFKHDIKLFAEVSRLIHEIITNFYEDFCGKEISIRSIVSHQTYGDMMRFNPHLNSMGKKSNITNY